MKIIRTTLLALISWNADLVCQHQQHDEEAIETGFYFIDDEETDIKLKYAYRNQSYFVKPSPILKTSDFERIELREETWPGLKWTHSLTIWLNDEGRDKWEKATTKAMKERSEIAFVLEDEIVTVLGVHMPMTNGVASIFGENLSKEALITIKEKLEK